eukprot:CAMPEP_0175972312 /NCGR_PEP_ID=MMETSP0108-20121206/42152_1 /TAXON_ID=195067 ORGANISM="Goniomonas pacifica, Strain CCMP1869" /NCGR_SAMPLE_ID=MMETSP0108 /ASSEMBLY_ACC=CAM_ASM_000204 /LENGTH=54 /DNA_ID=CAMNT_0017301601 /DNA_START=114 /DNA_END=274 /DNA_ORIENTATION=-
MSLQRPHALACGRSPQTDALVGGAGYDEVGIVRREANAVDHPKMSVQRRAFSCR